MKQILVAIALVLAGLVPGVSQAATIFSDNFNGETPFTGLNYITFANWAVSAGTVDLIGAGPPPFFNLPTIAGTGHVNYVDLDGSTFDAGIMRSDALVLLAGTTYDLTFDLAGSQRGDSNTLTYGIDLDGNGSLDDGISVTPGDITLGSATLFSTYTLSFTPSADTGAARIQFGQLQGNPPFGDNRGLLLDNVALNSRAVPEPASLMLLGAGLAAIGIWRRKAAKG